MVAFDPPADAQVVGIVSTVFQELCSKLSTVLITHDAHAIAGAADRVEVLQLGERVAREATFERLVGAMMGAMEELVG